MISEKLGCLCPVVEITEMLQLFPLMFVKGMNIGAIMMKHYQNWEASTSGKT